MLEDVIRRPGLNKHGLLVRVMKLLKRAGELPGIVFLIAYKPRATRHLNRFTHEVMRGPSELEPWFRELIAAYVSARNRCLF